MFKNSYNFQLLLDKYFNKNIPSKIVELANKLDNEQLQELEDYFRELRLYKERNNRCECGIN